MSKMSKIVETALDKKHREYVDDADKADEHMMERSLEEDEPYKIPKGIYRTKVETRDMFGCQMVIFNEVEDDKYLTTLDEGSEWKITINTSDNGGQGVESEETDWDSWD